ncbi:hypothetical protein QJQ45_021067, partial [Haematococcus lacustris]
IRVLNTKARTLREAPGAEEVHVADRELVAAIQALELTAGSTAHSLQRVVEAKAQYVKALAAHSTPADLRARWQWLHEGERAAGHFKGVLAHANSSLTAVRTHGGGLATTPSSIASVLVAHYAHISADPVCDSEAVQHVLAAVRAHANPVDHDVASQAGAPQVSCEEVRVACKHMAPGSAPGPDGLPVNVWRVGRGCLQPLLALLFTAIGNTHTMPHMFTWGAVCPISKSGNATSPANYRPITLLNTDYRVLARVLNARLVGVLGDSIGPEQSAFLPNRLIGDNIHFLQLLPAALRAQQGMPGLPSSAAVAFIDFAKAYDTISRPFLYAVIEAVGAGAFLPWVKVLLSDCRACVVVNGCKSPWAQWEAGVRQGCPLSPSLYLFVAWALSCWLHAQPSLGVVVAGQRRVCMQFADDTEVFIRSLTEADVQPLCLCMAVFKQASGQDMNTDKSTLLHVGHPTTHPAPSVVCGMPVVTIHKALGVHIHNDIDDVPHTTSIWTRLIEGVEHSFTKIARLHMSAMGRGLAASTFAVSRFLFHGEFMGLPPPPLLQRITSASQKLVDRGVPPDSSTRSPMPGVPGLLLSGAPSQGGFGLLPWKQHMLARHAVWACKLLGFLACDGLPLQPMQVRRRRELQAAMQATTPGRQRHLRNQLQRLQRPPHRAAWMSLTPLILLTASPHLHPAFHLLALARAKPGVSGNLPEAGLPGLLRRIVAALRGLGCPTDLTPELPLPVGPACSHIPVWGNPLLAMEDAQQPPAPFPQQAGAQALQWVAEWATTGFQELAAIPSLTNLSSLLHLCRVTQPAGRGDRVGSREWQRAVWGEEQVARSIAVAVRANPARCATGLFAMWARLPTGWQQEVARQAPLPAPADPQALQRVAVAMVMDRLGWLPKAPPTGRAPAPSPIPILEGATVKCFTRVLMEPVTMLRAEANARFVKDALAGMWSPPPTPTSAPHLPLPSSPPATQAQGEAWLASRVPTLWKLPWLNSSKEVMWRLAVNGSLGVRRGWQGSLPCHLLLPTGGQAGPHGEEACSAAGWIGSNGHCYAPSNLFLPPHRPLPLPGPHPAPPTRWLSDPAEVEETAEVVLVAHYARISADPVCDSEAVQHVLAAVRAHANPVDHDVASQAGAPQVSSIGNTHTMPHMFTWGAVCPISKSGNATSPANYRPITLLNTDYRVLARVLNARLVGVLGDSIGPEQSAFLPSRLIGDNIHFLQLLPAALRAQQGMPGLPSSAAVAFIDFAKAYDTISRPFLYAVIEAVGADVEERCADALRGLGCPADLAPELPLPVGPACSHIPVWGNPLLAMEDAQQPPAPFPQQAGAQALQWVAEWATTGFQELAAIPSLTNLSSLLHLCRVTQPAGRGGRVGSREWQRAVWGEEQVARSIAVAVRANPARCATGLFAMWARLPTGWQQEVARQAPLPAPADPQALQRVAVAMVMDRLGWLPKGPPTGRAPAPSPIPILEGATVKCLTRVLMEPVTMLRAEANARIVKDALAGMWSPPPPLTSAPHLPLPSSPPATQAHGEAWLASRLASLWKLPWLNSSKEVICTRSFVPMMTAKPCSRAHTPVRACRHWGYAGKGSGMSVRVYFTRTAMLVVLHELGQLPLQLYWFRAACKFWNTAKLSHSDLLMRVIKADVELGRSCQASWSAQFQLAARELMGDEFTLSPDMVLGTKAMEVKWLERWGRRWVGFEGDPRLPETVHRERCSYAAWFKHGDGIGINHMAPHLLNRQLSTEVRTSLTRFRLGNSGLGVEKARFEGVTFIDRTCTRCTEGVVDDAMHFIFECTATSSIREQPEFAMTLQNNNENLHDFMLSPCAPLFVHLAMKCVTESPEPLEGEGGLAA